MLPIDNVTSIYLTALIAIVFAMTQLILFRNVGKAVQAWALGACLQSFGMAGLLYWLKDPLPLVWIIAPLAILLGNLVTLSALGFWGGCILPKKPTLFCLVGVLCVGGLFLFSRSVGAPLGNLEVILMAPIAASLIYSAWFSGILAKKNHNKYIYLISTTLWVEGLLIAFLSLGAIAAMGEQYVILSSKVVLVVSLTYMIGTLLMNMSWSFQILEQLIEFKGSHYSEKLNDSLGSPVRKSNRSSLSVADIKNNEVIVNDKKGLSKTKINPMEIINPDLLSDAEKLALIDKLTDKEKEVYFLVIDDKKNDEIATLLNSTMASIKVHKSRMTSKLGIKRVEDLKKLMQPSDVTNVTNDAMIETYENSVVTSSQDSFNLS